jgi:putative membrane protein
MSVVDKKTEGSSGQYEQPQTAANLESPGRNAVIDWFIRLIKGALVGIGAILPGLSGGVLAVVFGLYEPLLRFLANLRHKFLENVRFFLPVGIGAVLGVLVFAAVVDFAFTNYAAQFTWLFIGFISGTFPSLLKTSGKEGRQTWHWFVLLVMAVGTYLFLHWLETANTVSVTPNIWIWLLSGILVGLGLVVPGLSPSNFLIYLGLYQPMASGIRQLDFGVIIPLTLGLVICILVFAKLVSWLFNKAYTFMYHFILGIVVGSTLAIIPTGVAGWDLVVCAVLFVIGVAGSFALSKLDEKYPHESLFLESGG